MSESHLVHAILKRWGNHPRLRLARINTGAAPMGPNRRLVRFNPPGTADIVGLVAPTGKLIMIEAKAARGRQRPAQAIMERVITAFGGAYCVARSLADVDQFMLTLGITR